MAVLRTIQMQILENFVNTIFVRTQRVENNVNLAHLTYVNCSLPGYKTGRLAESKKDALKNKIRGNRHSVIKKQDSNM